MIFLAGLSEIAPDGWFYYGLSILFAGTLIVMIMKYSNRIDKAIERIEENLQRLTKMQAVHDVKITNHEKYIDELKQRIK